jgi:hypothetical protein
MTTSEADSFPDYVNVDDLKYGCEEKVCELNYKYYIDGIALLIVAIFGTVGTVMSLVVLLKPMIITRRERPPTLSRTFSNVCQEKEKHFSIFLTALCIFDCSFLLLSILYIGLPAISCW